MAFIDRQAPESAIQTLLASLADSTIRQYTRPLRSWWLFCQERRYPTFRPSSEQVLEFLALEMQSVGSYSSLNTSRSAISLISNNQIGDDSLIKRFCKGAGNLKPSRPRYDHVWDPEPVIVKLKTFYPHEKLSLEHLTKKLLLLLALGSGQRCQTMSLLKVSEISFNRDILLIRVPDRIKTSAPGRSQPLLQFSRFTNNETLCIFSILSYYLDRTKELRPKDCDSLFISLKQPHKAVGAQTISRWIRQTLVDCGIDESFGAHSTRHASTSRAAEKGIAIDIINRAASWSGESRVFARFYRRPVVDPTAFSNAVLSLDK